MAAIGSVTIPVFARYNDKEIELGTITVPLTTLLEETSDGPVLRIKVGGED
jgi:hypothetical protein